MKLLVQLRDQLKSNTEVNVDEPTAQQIREVCSNDTQDFSLAVIDVSSFDSSWTRMHIPAI